MRPEIQLITVGVTDLGVSESFYTDGLGWVPILKLNEIVYYQIGHGLVFAIFSIFDFASDIGAPIGVDSAFSLGQSVDSPELVDAIIDQAREAGARILKEPQDAWFGGYHGYFADPDGHRWEISTGRRFSIADDGSVSLRLGYQPNEPAGAGI